ncbi:MAG: hypothetical protein QM669_03115 [Siphonobacter sp.]
MKNLKPVCVLFALVVLFTNCSKKEPVMNNCENEGKKVTDAANVYVNNPTVANCEAYKKAVIDALNACPDYYTGVSKQTLEDFKNTPCN